MHRGGKLFCIPFIDHRLDDNSAELHADRKKECDTAKKNYKKLLDDKVRDGLPESVLEEPGIWMDNSQLNDQGRPFSLAEQLRIVDKLEPARVQWNSCDSDDQRVAHLSSSLRKKLLPESERRRYPVSTQRPLDSLVRRKGPDHGSSFHFLHVLA
ncbi:hypothetical protein PF003_g29350 [Phytophthora fragariae]|nr:hypothetical protein PF003_g29350 [Phytophthora fragariae]